MLSLRRPSIERCAALLRRSESSKLSYAFPGSIERGETPRGFNRDRGRCLLGSGEEAWLAAVESFKIWRFMPTSVVEVIPPDTIECDQVVGVVFRGLGVWSVNPARIIRVHSSESPGRRIFGFTYATLPGHVEQGEERFLLNWDRESDEVWYELDAVSRPNHVLAWIAYPYSRWQQARFRKESCASMKSSVDEIQAASEPQRTRLVSRASSPNSVASGFENEVGDDSLDSVT